VSRASLICPRPWERTDFVASRPGCLAAARVMGAAISLASDAASLDDARGLRSGYQCTALRRIASKIAAGHDLDQTLTTAPPWLPRSPVLKVR
jgi:hypothetical protein